ncbi:hypothetical protein LIX60_31170 [Streptomyces sp. S07_1.15]|uniref:hypothetical protein n=1 Tax=Streptomyces sp. S07_1.15 TaxID=2873925 RepID=UPI001D15C4AC|nr:hypothetical protein [Streptomyces sp. S07_1.15]MCC3655845.1 hypothetical protein [Streptomyces sp. S07_1.15]
MTTTQTALPGWLIEAETAHQKQQRSAAAAALRRAKQHARQINTRLADLGIEPIKHASVGPRGQVQPAKLVGADYEQQTYEVRAVWSEQDETVELHTADWESPSPEFGRVRLLQTLADVAAARRETPTIPARRRDYRLEAVDAMNYQADHLSSGDVEALVRAINGITAALLMTTTNPTT